MIRHKLLIIVLLISFIVGLGHFEMNRISASAPIAPIPLSPQGDINLCDSFLRNVSFKWTPVAGATGYTLQVAATADFSSILINYSSTNTEVYLGGINLSPGLYYWRVQAYNLDGTSAWSSVLSFHVIPSAPVLVYPANNGFVLPNTSFTWTTCYPFETEFQLSNRPDFSLIILDINFNANQYLYKGPYVYEYKFSYPLSSGIYWWRVRTKLGTETSPWVTQIFVVMIPPQVAPAIIAPQNNSLIASRNVNLKWNYVSDADRYQIQICRGNTLIVDTVVFTTSYNFIGEDNTFYYFRVRAGNPVGWGEWSNYSNFRILLPPNTPILVSPFNRAVLQNNNIVVLNWNLIPTAASYLVEISNINTGAIQTFEVLAPNTVLNFNGDWGNTYLWRVKSKNASGESDWSASWVFTIQENIPPKLEIDDYPHYTNKSSVIISGKVSDLESGLDTLYLGLNPVPVSSDNTFKINIYLNEGANSFTFIAIDKAGNKTQKTIGIVKDTTPPEIEITFPITPTYPSYEGITVIDDIKITGIIKDLLPVQLWINNQNIPLDSGNFVYQTNLNYGPNKVYLKAQDLAGNVTEKTLLISKISPVAKCVFQVGNPIMKVYKINEKGNLQEYAKEIDPGRGTVPVIVNNRTFVPIRSLIESIDGTVTWVASERKIIITLPNRNITIELWINKNWARITNSYGTVSWVEIEKGNPKVTPFIKNDRSYFPLRFIVEALGFKVNWNSVMEIITIEFPLTP